VPPGLDVKVLGTGSLDRKLTVVAHAFSSSAREGDRSRRHGTVIGEPAARSGRGAWPPSRRAGPKAEEPEPVAAEARSPRGRSGSNQRRKRASRIKRGVAHEPARALVTRSRARLRNKILSPAGSWSSSASSPTSRSLAPASGPRPAVNSQALLGLLTSSWRWSLQIQRRGPWA